MPPMAELIQIALLTITGVLRRLWQRLTGRVPVPVRVPVRRFSLPSQSSSRIWFEPVSSRVAARGRW